MTPLSPGLSTHSLSVKSNTIINASAGRMASLVTFLIWQTVSVALAFLLLFLLEVAAANLDNTKTWWKPGLSSGVEDVNCSIIRGCVHYTLIYFFFQMCVGNNDISSQCKKMHAFKSICVQCPLHLQMSVTAK